MNPLEYEKNRWKNYAKVLHFQKLEDAEKDYLQEMLLTELFGDNCRGLVFRGGTAISKIYGSGRFSEDLDFILDSEMDIKEISVYIENAISRIRLRYDTEYKLDKYRNMLKYSIKIRGPIYSVVSNEQAKQTIRIDLNTYERPILAIKTLERISIYEDLRPYVVRVVCPEELFVDKVKVMLERTAPIARDLWDAWFLSKKFNMKLDTELISKKIRLYGKNEKEEFSLIALRKVIKQIEFIWDKEMTRLLSHTQKYNDVVEDFEKVLNFDNLD